MSTDFDETRDPVLEAARAEKNADDERASLSEKDVKTEKESSPGADSRGQAFLGFELDELVGVVPSAEAKRIGLPPREFEKYDLDIDTEHTCPRCGYEWS